MQTATRDNAAVLFLDLQSDIIGGARTIGRQKLKRAAGALAKLCSLHGIPAFLSAIPEGGSFVRSVTETLGDVPVRERTFTTAFADTGLVDDLAATGRKVVVLAGVASEIVVLRTALDACAAGYDVQIAIDACGGFSERTEAAAWHRATAAGAAMTSVVTFAAELAGDFTTDLGKDTMAALYDAAGR